MLTILGSLIGFGSSFAPRILDFFQDRSDKKHELAIMERQAQINLDRSVVDANIREVESLHKHDASLDGGTFINGLRASVRPVIAYLFMILFMVVEITAFISIMDNAGAGQAVLQIWDQDVMALWASVLAFYFGGRAYGKK